MAVHIDSMLNKSLKDGIANSKLLVVGAGGIGCELLKNLVLTGCEDLHVIDLDTIELSNLNRQFLFHKQHIGRPKSVVAKESILKFNPRAKIVAYHDSITSTKYDVEFFRQFTLVANALDNVAARSHVNRMCVAADIPLLESGSSGYVGQVTVHRKKTSECFECLPRPAQRTYPGCTIRNTPSEPIHCIVWAKHLFNQLFGETDADEEVSPDFADPELNDTGNKSDLAGNVTRVSTREWAKASNYDPHKIFNKLFLEDITYLNKMNDLWEKRSRPKPLNWDDLPDAVVPGSSRQEAVTMKDRVLWNIKQCAEVFRNSLVALKKKAEEVGSDGVLIWDKDDEHCMDFVASCANLRAHCFHIQQKSKFDIKAMAGNIVPAIATTNAVIAGLLVLQIMNILKGAIDKCKTAWLNANYGASNKLISSAQLEKPNPDCFVCSPKTPEVSVRINPKMMTVRTLEEKIIKEKLHMVQPDVVINDGSGKILISSDPEDMQDEMMDKPLSDFSITADTRLLCEDFFQQYKVLLVILPSLNLSGQDFQFETDLTNVKPEPRVVETDSVAEPSKSQDQNICERVSDEDEITEVEAAPQASMKKRNALEEENGMQPPSKKAKTSNTN